MACGRERSRLARYAIIDIGTVTTRLLIADVSFGDEDSSEVLPCSKGNVPLVAPQSFVGAALPCAVHLHELRREYRITNLGEGLAATGELSLQAMARTAQAVGDYVAIRDAYATKEYPLITLCVATAASRDARNAEVFRAMLACLGISARIIPGEQEARLSFLGASRTLWANPELSRSLGNASTPPCVAVLDIGGGSVELIAGPAGGEPMLAQSFPYGCRRMTERFLHTDPPTPQELAALRAALHADSDFDAFLKKVKALCPRTLIGVAGTATSVVSIAEQMGTYDAQRVNGYCVERAVLRGILERLAALPCAVRRETIGLDPQRADVIVAGMAVLDEVLEGLGQRSYYASESDLLQGAILDAFDTQCRQSR